MNFNAHQPPGGWEGLEGFTDSINTIQQDKRFPKRIKKTKKVSLPLLLVGFLRYIPPLNETSSSGRGIPTSQFSSPPPQNNNFLTPYGATMLL